MIAESVEESVGIGGNPGSGKGDERAQGRRLAFQRKLLDQFAIEIGVQGGIVLNQIASADCYRGRSRADLQADLHNKRHGGPEIHILAAGSESVGAHREVIWVEWKVDELILSRAVGVGRPRESAHRVL